ncbi:hypothetical protein EW145_g1324 [Phellinidium pouzarii]|uniref:Hydrophobin n=1 Tax=Phellinidium pouzarii TaxID=167371 RepID=A0A4S4LKG9_9AGAM|nr:hypothetical protein EW145_g1324 [Phellinidium pouzarii]
MRFFGLFTIAAAALAPFVSAAPLVNADAAAVAGVAAGVSARSVNVDAAASVAGRDGTKGCQEILIDLKVKLSVSLEEFTYIKKENATTAVITPILKDVVSIVNAAVVELKALIGEDVSVILCNVNGGGLVAVTVIAGLLADILGLVCGALSLVLSVVADVSILLDVIVLVDGLLECLVPLVLSLASVIVALGLDVVGQVLTIC